MSLKFLVEGRSEQIFLKHWCKRCRVSEFAVFPHEGRGTLPANEGAAPNPKIRTLLHQLPAKLRGFAGANGKDTVVVLVDADDDDPQLLRKQIEAMAARVAPTLDVRVCVAVEELEAFYLGDLRALAAAYPNADMAMARNYVPDSIIGTWEFFGEVIDDDSGDKVRWAESMGPRVTTGLSGSRSQSFRRFAQVVKTAPVAAAKPVNKTFRHRARPKSSDGKRPR